MRNASLSPKMPLPLGSITITPGAAATLPSLDDVVRCLRRHSHGDWGEVCDEDARTNDSAIVHGGRVMSSYTISGQPVWVITEADRASTCILLPDEY